ncbi:hypothetical protein AHMF7605_20940 [Adhaeribacter arboris]|uniref:Uncharacterized protein n=1 Tax=Adhaeribacter arboris TaxID=2072846 RepID=A0A2T2YJV9_9BACT|nr:hypothetical protein [Adhaeribacter arboris]PSR55788.1 hypothetical protein AHMF7605_20940 [Adhaeribacter arboris]
MELLVSVASKLYDQVKAKFEKDIKQRTSKLSNNKLPDTEEAIWNYPNNTQSLFRELIGDFEPLYLRNKVKYKTERRYKKSGEALLNFSRPDKLTAFLIYLDYQGEDLKDKLNAFLETVDSKERLFHHTHLNQSRPTIKAEKPREDVEFYLEQTAKLLSKRYTPRLLGKRFWLYFYGYDKFIYGNDDLPDAAEDKWSLVKVEFAFTDMSGFDLKVTLTNTGAIEHYNYVGKTDFLTSSEQVLVINCRTEPDLTRQLNIKLHIGTGNGDIFIGQYLNYETEGRIISGSLLLQKIPDAESDIQPKIYRVPNLLPGIKFYTEDFEGVDKNILQYLHDERLNYRRTSIKAGHTLRSLEKWLKEYEKIHRESI